MPWLLFTSSDGWIISKLWIGTSYRLWLVKEWKAIWRRKTGVTEQLVQVLVDLLEDIGGDLFFRKAPVRMVRGMGVMWGWHMNRTNYGSEMEEVKGSALPWRSSFQWQIQIKYLWTSWHCRSRHPPRSPRADGDHAFALLGSTRRQWDCAIGGRSQGGGGGRRPSLYVGSLSLLSHDIWKSLLFLP